MTNTPVQCFYSDNYIFLHYNIQTPIFLKLNLFFIPIRHNLSIEIIKQELDTLEGNWKYDRIYIIYSSKLCLTVWILHNQYFTYSSLPCWLVCCRHQFFSYQDCFSAFHFSFWQYHYDVNCWWQNILSIYFQNRGTINFP